MSLFLSCIFCHTNLKNVLQKEMKDWTLPVLYSCWLNQWKWLAPDPMGGIWIFLSNGEGLDCFLWLHVLPKLSEITVTCQKSVKIKKWGQVRLVQHQQNDYQFSTVQSQQNDHFEIYNIFSHGEARNITFGQQVNLIQRVLLGTLPQEILTSVPHIHMTLTNLFISSHRGYCYQIWPVKTNSW